MFQELVERNVGVAATYDFSAINHCGPDTVIRYLEEEAAGHHIYLVERANSLPTKAARIFKQFFWQSPRIRSLLKSAEADR